MRHKLYFSILFYISVAVLIYTAGCIGSSPSAPPDPKIKKVICSHDEKRPAPPKTDVRNTGVKTPVKPVFPARPSSPSKTEKPPVKPPLKEISGINELVIPDAYTSQFLADESFITKWNILGPFKFSNGEDKSREVLHKAFIPEEKELSADVKAPVGLSWQYVQFKGGDFPGKINLTKLYKDFNSKGVVYAVAFIKAPKDLSNMVLYCGSDDYIKIWLNGDLIHAYNRELRVGKWDQDSIENIKLKKGLNKIIVKCVHVEGEWNFFLRFTDKAGMPFCVKH